VVRTRVGYAGGTRERPTYRDLDDHAEALQLDYDPARITFRDLLDVFWAEHDPTAPPYSRQYAAILFVHDAEQEREARASLQALAATLEQPIRTEIRSLSSASPSKFWRAEDYHQKYALRSRRELADALRKQHASEQAFVDDPLVTKVNGWLAGFGELSDLERSLPDLKLSEKLVKELRESAQAAHGRAAACPK
jgi:methionine-S-sulfoxide reductase